MDTYFSSVGKSLVFRRILWSFFIVCLTIFGSYSHSIELRLPGMAAIEDATCQQTIERQSNQRKEISRIRYFDFRRLVDSPGSYLNLMGPRFVDRLSELGPEDVILDLGAGNAYALKEYLTLKDHKHIPNLPDIYHRAQAIALGYEQPLSEETLDPQIEQIQSVLRRPIFGDNYGRKFQDIPDQELEIWNGKITDIWSVFGVFDYVHADEFRSQLPRILKLLKQGGQFRQFTNLVSMKFVKKDGTPFITGSDYQSQRQNEVEVEKRIYQFYSSIRGTKLIYFANRDSNFIIVLERTSGPIIIPEIIPIRHEDSTPHNRDFYFPGYRAK